MTMTFASLGVPEPVIDALASEGITSPFPIQAEAIEPGLRRRDVCGQAPTGSGKTIAFGIPLVTDLAPAKPGRPTALVLAPTRELADQIAAELSMLGRPLGVSVLAVYGGVGYGGQRSGLRKGADVVVACPGRLEDLMSDGTIRLDDVSRVVLDEADRMADMGFLPAVRRILDGCRDDRQTSLFSATFDGAIGKLRSSYTRRPVMVEIDSDEAEPDVEHSIVSVERPDRVDATAEAVERYGSTIVFCRTRRGADRVTKQLRSRGVEASAIHGSRSQGQRTRALDAFSTGKVQALVATDVAARGIHVDNVACVVHFDPPGDDATYLHRSGRTGRAGNHGVALSLVTDDETRRDATKRMKTLNLANSASAPSAPPEERTSTPASSSEARAARTRHGSPPADRARRSKRATGDGRSETPKHARKRRETSRPEPTRQPKSGVTTTSGSSQSTRLSGHVKFYDARRGFGFIDHGDGELFFHSSGLTGKVKAGQSVRFDVGRGPKGPQAENVVAA